MTLLELIIACAILMVLSSAALPIAKYTIVRQKEAELRRDLREMKDAIDRIKTRPTETRSAWRLAAKAIHPTWRHWSREWQLGASQRPEIRFLRKIPIDPMTGRADWGLRAVQDDPDSTSWGGKERVRCVFEVDRNGAGWNKYSDW